MRRSRAEAKQDTRDRLLDAARRVFLRAGFHAATVEMVAAEAGFTKGAIYSGFASKADLFLALYEKRVVQRTAELAQRLATVAGQDIAVEASRAWAETLRRDRAWHLVLIEFWVFAARDRSIRSRFARLHAQLRAALARDVVRARAAAGRALPADPELVARAHMALGNGFALEGFLEPEAVAGSAYERAAVALDEALDDTAPHARQGISG
jgi:AcrR family transcriptional regulator